MFWKYLTAAMEACEMVPSKLDPCLFVGKHVLSVFAMLMIFCSGPKMSNTSIISLSSYASKVCSSSKRMMLPAF